MHSGIFGAVHVKFLGLKNITSVVEMPEKVFFLIDALVAAQFSFITPQLASWTLKHLYSLEIP